MPEEIYGNSYANSSKRRGITAIIPGIFGIIVSILVSLGLIVLGNIGSATDSIGITAQDKQSFDGLFKNSFNTITDKLELVPYGDIIVVFLINFIIVLTIVNIIFYAFEQSRELKHDIDSNQSGALSLNHKKFWSTVLINLLQRAFIGSFAVLWGLVFFFILLPAGIKLGGSYIGNFGDYSKIPKFIIGLLIVSVGTIIWSIYLKIAYNNRQYR